MDWYVEFRHASPGHQNAGAWWGMRNDHEVHRLGRLRLWGGAGLSRVDEITKWGTIVGRAGWPVWHGAEVGWCWGAGVMKFHTMLCCGEKRSAGGVCVCVKCVAKQDRAREEVHCGR